LYINYKIKGAFSGKQTLQQCNKNADKKNDFIAVKLQPNDFS
jgi:hypothetical protein